MCGLTRGIDTKDGWHGPVCPEDLGVWRDISSRAPTRFSISDLYFNVHQVPLPLQHPYTLQTIHTPHTPHTPLNLPRLLPANMQHTFSPLYPATKPQTLESETDRSAQPQKWTLALTFEEDHFGKGWDRINEIFRAVVRDEEGLLPRQGSDCGSTAASMFRLNQGLDPASTSGHYRYSCPVAAKRTEGGKSFATSFATGNAPDWLKKTEAFWAGLGRGMCSWNNALVAGGGGQNWLGGMSGLNRMPVTCHLESERKRGGQNCIVEDDQSAEEGGEHFDNETDG